MATSGNIKNSEIKIKEYCLKILLGEREYGY